MAISYVGGKGAGTAGQGGGSISLTTGLTGGSGGAPIEGDLVVVTVSIGTAARAPTTAISTPSGYTALTAQRTTASTQDTNVQTCYKIMTSTPDTAVTIPASGNNADGISYAIQVFRGVDPTTPMDVTPTYATGSGTNSRPDPAAITPATAGAWIVVCGGGAAATGAAYTAAYLTNLITNFGADTNDALIGCGYYTGWASGSYDPAQFGGGSATTADSWGATTLALRPLTLSNISGSLSVQETGSDAFTGSGQVDIVGSVTAQEAGSDTVTATGQVTISGSATLVEVGSDTFTGSGLAMVSGVLATQEAGSDALTASGVLAISGALVAQEVGSDVLASSGAVAVSGAWTSQEVGSDTFTGSGSTLGPPITGSVAVQETGSDTFAGSALLAISGALGVGESGQDSFVASGVIPVSGNAILTEVGGDTFAGSGLVRVSGAITAQESGSDTFTGSGLVLITGSMTVFQPTTDTFTGSGAVLVTGSGAATETGSDTFTGSGQFVVAPISGQMVAIEAGSDTFTASAIALIEGLLSVVEAGPDVFVGGGQSREPVTYPLAGRVQSLPSAEPTFPGVAEVYPNIGDQNYPLQGAAQPFPLG